MTRLLSLVPIALLLFPVSLKAECDAEAGRRQFNKCVACHSVESGIQMMGPSLYDLFGRKVGSVEGFTFSVAMEEADVVWTDQTLSEFLGKPMTFIPGSVMPFGGIKKPEQRKALICYLKQFSDEYQ